MMIRRPFLLLAALALGACAMPTDSSGDVADVRGAWAFTGQQVTPSVQLTGTLTITGQDGDLVTGTLTWEERDALGVSRLDGGPVSGRVIERGDVDFDLIRTTGTRRHVARLSADTMEGSWVQIQGGLSGSFRAVRGTR